MKRVTEKRTMLYMPADLYGRVSSAARLSGKTMAAFVRDALAKTVGAPKELTYHERLQIGYGLFKDWKEDGLTYQRRMRAEWGRRERRLEKRWETWRRRAGRSGHQPSD